MFKMLFIAFLTFGFTDLTFANNIWDDCTPLDLGTKVENQLVSVTFITDPKHLSEDIWSKFKTSFISFYETKWKDQDPKDLGIQGTIREFLEKQYELNMEELRTNPDACFLYISSKTELGETIPLLGIFSEKEMAPLKGKSRASISNYFILRLLVCADPAAMKTLPQLAAPLLSAISPSISDHDCRRFLTLSRKTNAAENKLFLALGFRELEDDEVSTELKKHYDLNYYLFFEKTIE